MQQNPLFTVSSRELLQALDSIETSLGSLAFRCTNQVSLTQELTDALSLLSHLAFGLEHNAIAIPGKKLLVTKIKMLCRKITRHPYCYTGTQQKQALTDFLSAKAFKKALLQVQSLLQQNENLVELYRLVEPSLQNILAARQLTYHNWVWWSEFIVRVLQENPAHPWDLENLLLELNYNTPAFKLWLTARLNHRTREITSAGEMIDYLSTQFICFKKYNAGTGYLPGQQSVTGALLAILKMHLAVVRTAAPVIKETPARKTKLKTALSVPQLALFLRLMIDMKIIEEDNYTSLLKTVAAITATSKTADISPESLRNNFYAPNTVARQVMKDYLLGMLNLVKTY